MGSCDVFIGFFVITVGFVTEFIVHFWRLSIQQTGWWIETFLDVHPRKTVGNDPTWRSSFSDWLKLPTRYSIVRVWAAGCELQRNYMGFLWRLVSRAVPTPSYHKKKKNGNPPFLSHFGKNNWWYASFIWQVLCFFCDFFASTPGVEIKNGTQKLPKFWSVFGAWVHAQFVDSMSCGLSSDQLTLVEKSLFFWGGREGWHLIPS